MPTEYKKIKDNLFEKTSTCSETTILNKDELLKTKKFLEENIAKFQAQLDGVVKNLDGIDKIK